MQIPIQFDPIMPNKHYLKNKIDETQPLSKIDGQMVPNLKKKKDDIVEVLTKKLENLELSTKTINFFKC